MRHLKAGRRLNRNATHRLALMRNLTLALVEHGRIITTVAKAKEARRFVEKLITLGKEGTLHARRLALSRLPHRETVAKIFDDLAPRYQERHGGYTRVIKRHERRLGDAGETAFLELIPAGEVKMQKRAPAPIAAPRVTETLATTSETTTPPATSETPPATAETTTPPATSETTTAPASSTPTETPPPASS
jgi:large subunit ribosomal protein L17